MVNFPIDRSKRLALPIELTVKGDRRIDSLRIHRSTTLTNEDITTQRGIRTTTPARTLLDVAPRHDGDQLPGPSTTPA